MVVLDLDTFISLKKFLSDHPAKPSTNILPGFGISTDFGIIFGVESHIILKDNMEKFHLKTWDEFQRFMTNKKEDMLNS